MFPTTSRTQTTRVLVRLFGWLEVGGAVSEEAGGADGFGEDDADGDEDGAGSGREGDSDFDASALGIFIAAAKSDAALGKIFADGECFLVGLMRSREFDIPEIGTRFENVDGIKEAFRFAINFGEDAGTSGSHAVTIEQALKRDFLAGEKLFCDSHNAAVAADEQGYGGNAAHHSGGGHAGCCELD